MVNVTTSDNYGEFTHNIEELKRLQVYVGVPEERSTREESSQINNAELAFLLTNGVRALEMREEMQSNVDSKGYHKAYDMYMHEHGSPIWQIPPRPIIQPAIEYDKEVLSEILGKALKSTLDGNFEEAEMYLNQAGLEGQAVSQDWFTNPLNGWVPNSPVTIEAKGSDRPNIDTGELRKAITYVVKKEGE